jgi:plastocyanin
MGHRKRIVAVALAMLAAAAVGHVQGQRATANMMSVDIKDLAYSPTTIQVNQGDTVTWMNSEEIMPHDVTSGAVGQADMGQKFGSELMLPGQTFAVTFSEPGEYVYLCKLHPTMTGVVIVSPS